MKEFNRRTWSFFQFIPNLEYIECSGSIIISAGREISISLTKFQSHEKLIANNGCFIGWYISSPILTMNASYARMKLFIGIGIDEIPKLSMWFSFCSKMCFDDICEYVIDFDEQRVWVRYDNMLDREKPEYCRVYFVSVSSITQFSNKFASSRGNNIAVATEQETTKYKWLQLICIRWRIANGKRTFCRHFALPIAHISNVT